MKNKILFLLIVIAGFSSCDDVLNIAPDGRKTIDEIFTDDATTAAYLNSCYLNFPKLGLRNYFNTNYRIAFSDDAWAGYLQIMPVYKGSMTSSYNVQENDYGVAGWDNALGFWNIHWRNIRNCNLFLSKIETAKVNLELDRKRWTAEAKALRAFYNFDLIKRYGPMPIITSPGGLNFDTKSLKRETFKACIDNVIKDCDEAIATEEFPWRITAANEKFRFTKAIAEAIRSEAILFAASDLWNDGENHWAEAEKITKNALDTLLLNGYELYTVVRTPTKFQSAYQEYFCSVTDYSATPIDKETILASADANGSWYNVSGLTLMNPNQSGLNPTQELVDAYGMKASGKPILKLEKPYLDEMHLEPNYLAGSGYDPLKPYDGRDPRFYATIYYNGAKRYNRSKVLTTVETFKGGNCEINPSIITKSGTGYYSKKYDHPESASPSIVNTSYRIFRLAELYLNYAEAANENGHLTEAIAAINKIRERATMPLINAATISGKDEARLIIRNERRVELAYEENRYFDNRRYVKPDGDLSATDKYVTGMWIERKGTSPNYTYEYRRCVVGDTYSATTNTWTNTGLARACYTNKYLRWPIEMNEAKRLYGATGVFWQNPGW